MTGHLYRTKPCEIFAIQWTGDNPQEIREFCGKDKVSVVKYMDGHVVCTIDTLEGIMRADVGDYIIKGMLGEFYPCNPEAFKKKYELI